MPQIDIIIHAGGPRGEGYAMVAYRNVTLADGLENPLDSDLAKLETAVRDLYADSVGHAPASIIIQVEDAE